MKKIWSYISAVLSGILIGLVVAFELLKDSINNVVVKKVKVKGKDNDPSISLPVHQEVDQHKTKKRKKIRHDKIR